MIITTYKEEFSRAFKKYNMHQLGTGIGWFIKKTAMYEDTPEHRASIATKIAGHGKVRAGSEEKVQEFASKLAGEIYAALSQGK